MSDVARQLHRDCDNSSNSSSSSSCSSRSSSSNSSSNNSSTTTTTTSSSNNNSSNSSNPVVCLAGSSAVKRKALKNVFCGFDVVSVAPCPSGVNEQPVGDAETLRGATQRLKAAVKLSADETSAAFVVAIENGIEVRADEQVYDFAWVLVYDTRTKTTGSAMSAAVPFPSSVAKAAMQAPESVTAGDLLLESGQVANGNDPHRSLCGVPRSELLAQAVRIAVGVAQRQCPKNPPVKAEDELCSNGPHV